jgi:hypothetical protein
LNFKESGGQLNKQIESASTIPEIVKMNIGMIFDPPNFFRVVTELTMKITALWDVTLCSSVDRNLLPLLQKRRDTTWRHIPEDNNLSVCRRVNVRFHRSTVLEWLASDIPVLLSPGVRLPAWSKADVDFFLYGPFFPQPTLTKALLIIFYRSIYSYVHRNSLLHEVLHTSMKNLYGCCN